MFTALFHAPFSFGLRSVLPRQSLSCLVLASSAVASVNIQAQPTLTLDQALRAAQDRSRQLVAQDAAAAGWREMAVSAGQRPDPTLKVGVNNLPIDGPDRLSLTRDFMTMRSVCRALIGAVLLAQMAVSAYACPGLLSASAM